MKSRRVQSDGDGTGKWRGSVLSASCGDFMDVFGMVSVTFVSCAENGGRDRRPDDY